MTPWASGIESTRVLNQSRDQASESARTEEPGSQCPYMREEIAFPSSRIGLRRLAPPDRLLGINITELGVSVASARHDLPMRVNRTALAPRGFRVPAYVTQSPHAL